MTRMLITAWALLLGATSLSAAQESSDAAAPIAINDLRAPASPGFVLLDVTPSSIARPENPKALIANILTTAKQGDGFPKNYALEVAPYWMRSHPNLTFASYQRPNVGESITRSLGLSIATAPLLDEAADTPTTIGTRVGLGIRADLVGGSPNPAIEKLTTDLEGVNIKLIIELEKADQIPDEQAREAKRKEVVDAANQEASALAQRIQQLEHQRVGFFVTFAAGQVWEFPADAVEQHRRGRWGTWLTPAYRFDLCVQSKSCTTTVDVMGVVRVTGQPGEDDQWDFGGRLSWQPNAELSVSGEFLRRRGSNGDGTSDRSVGIVEYRINDDILLYGSFGRDFKDDDTRKTLVSLFGLNFGFGKPPEAKSR